MARRFAPTLFPLIAAAMAAFLVLPVAATSRFWQVATQADFLRGDIEQLSIDEHGRLMLGPEMQPLHDPGVPVVWTVIPARDGFFIGTGNDGKVLRVGRNGESTVFYDSNELEVHALATTANGELYVGTSPDGRIYRVDALGRASTFFDPEDKYIWSIAVDDRGMVFAATGDKGVVYRITPDGKGAPFFTTKSTHALTLSRNRSGDLLVGTGTPGRVYKVDPQGRGFLLLDTPFQEIRALRFDDRGSLYVAAQSGRPPQGGDNPFSAITSEPAPAAVASVSTEITSISVIDMAVSGQPVPTVTPSDRRSAAGAIYRVLPDGLWDELWESRDDAPYDVALDSDGALLVATGGKGKIFRLTGEPMRASLLARVAAQQATMLHRDGARTIVATANPGRLVSLSSARARQGRYESDVRDARFVASWGSIAWRAMTPGRSRVEVQTRSGNTRTPDEGWSDWSTSYDNAEGSPMTSPSARFLQWRATLTGAGDSPVLTSVTAAYLQRNIRPDVSSVTVHPPGVVFQKQFSSGEMEIAGFADETVERRVVGAAGPSGGLGGAPALGRRTYQKGLQTILWRAEDENGDELTYDLLYRREGETAWKLLKGGLTDTLLVWDTSTAPNGAYVVKVVASDGKSNAPERALKGERETNAFDVDNAPPAVSIGGSRRESGAIVLTLEVRDGDSPLTRVEYSVDAQAWQSAFPQDGILDGRTERFALRLEANLTGRTLVVRATDSLNNVGAAEAVLK